MSVSSTKISKKQELKDRAESDLLFFIRLVAPHRELGHIHEELISWWTRSEAKSHQLVLLPRAHQKSIMVAYRVAWEITRNPATSILYISATANLAEKQLKAVQDILTCKKYREYWPEMVNEQEGKREKWTTSEICVDHPLRKAEGVRDSTVFTAGLTTSITGLHCDVAVLDDVVVKENAYTADGRSKVAEQYSLLSSIENPGAVEWAVGTRYHPKDLYDSLVRAEEELYDEEGNQIGSDPIYEVFQRVVEDHGDGTGQYLWPRKQRTDGKWFGFNTQILMKKKGQYLDKTQFRAQYYNDPNSKEDSGISNEQFQYYEPKFLKNVDGDWYIRNKKLNIFACLDLASSLTKKADYTAIVVVGIDSDNHIYVLDVDRFKTNKTSEYVAAIKRTQYKWGYRKIRIEANGPQKQTVEEIKRYLATEGVMCKVDAHSVNRHEGSKAERMSFTLEPRYESGLIWHYRGGNCELLEEELVLQNPPHDDIKDALTGAIAISVAPRRSMQRQSERKIVTHPRFGGVAFR